MTVTKPQKRRLARWLSAWPLRPIYQAAVLLGAVILSIYLVGLAQRNSWIQPPTQSATTTVATPASPTQYICPMMCTPPLPEPGRCPVCGMELVAATAGGADADSRSVTIPTADRRLIGIETVAARRAAVQRTLRGIGMLEVDESRLARIPTDTGGRIEELLVNFTGQFVQAGDALVNLYAPDLFAAQTELLTLKQTRRASSARRYTLSNVREELISAARNRLVELGMTREQIAAMESRGQADTRVTVTSPQSGTVTKMLLREGQYVKAGDLVCEVADLSNVWLMIELFPEDAALVRYGRRVVSQVTSLPNESFEGRVSFVDPMVDPKTKSVKVRIEIANPTGRLRPGDEATVEMLVPAELTAQLYDEQLAGKWICPEHPHEIRSVNGTCDRSGKPLVQTSKFGYADSPQEVEQPIVVPRDAVLMAGAHSAIYVETKSGRFELRQVTLGPKLGDEIVIVNGIAEGELVAASGNFLIDSQTQLAGNPSLIDPSRAAAELVRDDWEIELPPIGPVRSADDPALEEPPSLEPPSLEPPSLEPPSLEPPAMVKEQEAEDDENGQWELPPITTPVPAADAASVDAITEDHSP